VSTLAPKLPPAPEPVPQLLRDLIHEKTGIFFEADRLDTLLDKLSTRVVAHGCATYLDYYYILKYESAGTSEWLRVMDVFSVPETYFWREADQLRALVTMVVPRWFAKSPSTPLRIWSAACATGEEPYSIVMALQEAGWGSHPIEVRASDASEAALEKARSGIYRERSFRSLPEHLRRKYFQSKSGDHHIDPAIATRVKFERANLLAEPETRPLASAEVIFCRNVFIYFSAAAIARVVASFARQAVPGNHLFVGASESLLKVSDDYEILEMSSAFVYRRKEHA
jgi:chemotaxis protein methyltransferase CheR